VWGDSRRERNACKNFFSNTRPPGVATKSRPRCTRCVCVKNFKRRLWGGQIKIKKTRFDRKYLLEFHWFQGEKEEGGTGVARKKLKV